MNEPQTQPDDWRDHPDKWNLILRIAAASILRDVARLGLGGVSGLAAEWVAMHEQLPVGSQEGER